MNDRASPGARVVDEERIMAYYFTNIRKSMTNADIIANRGTKMLFDRKKCLETYGSDYLLKKAVAERRIYRLEEGVYSDEPSVPEEAVIAFRHPEGVFTMLFAFYHHGLTDLPPDSYELATDRDSAKIRDGRIKQVFSPKGILRLGREQAMVNGYPIAVYGKERMLVELLRNKNKLPYDLYKEISRNYRAIVGELDLGKVGEFASSCPKGKMAIRLLREEIL